MEKQCLLIDNEKQSTSREKIIRLAKSRGLKVFVEEFNVGNPELKEVLEDGKIAIPKVLDHFKKKFRKYHFDLIAFDWSLDDENVDGVELIRQFQSQNLLKKSNAILYSGELTEAVKSYFDAYKNNTSTFSVNWKKIKTLIDTPIMGFFDRLNYEEKIVETLQNLNKTLDVEHYLVRKLKENSELIFNNISPAFEGKTFGQIAEIIESENSQSQKFTQDLIDQSLAFLLKINPRT